MATLDEKGDISHHPHVHTLDDTLDQIHKTTTVDTLHGDEAVKVLATYSGDQRWSEIEEKKLLKKIDRKLLPFLIITYGLQYYDKAMLSQAVSLSYLLPTFQPTP
jgi:hypothetical protein